ncbi:MAG: hypothetical protein EOM29_09195 [Bacteroidia bacterium]|nr:hypothetical protein [Bacteroidia bacterium]
MSRRTIIRKAKKAQIKSQIGKNAKLNRYVVIGVQYMKSNKVKQKVIAEAFKISERSVVNATKINVQDYIDSLGKKVHRWNPDNN